MRSPIKTRFDEVQEAIRADYEIAGTNCYEVNRSVVPYLAERLGLSESYLKGVLKNIADGYPYGTSSATGIENHTREHLTSLAEYIRAAEDVCGVRMKNTLSVMNEIIPGFEFRFYDSVAHYSLR